MAARMDGGKEFGNMRVFDVTVKTTMTHRHTLANSWLLTACQPSPHCISLLDTSCATAMRLLSLEHPQTNNRKKKVVSQRQAEGGRTEMLSAAPDKDTAAGEEAQPKAYAQPSA